MFLRYQHNKIFTILSAFLLISIVLVIKECDYPILINIDFFTHNSNEKLFYNISISYIAAYFFYILQTYIPQVTANRKSINALKNDIISELELLNLFNLIIHEYTNIDVKTHIIKKKRTCNPLYFVVIEKDSTYVTRFSLELSTEEALNNLVDLHTKICSNYFFTSLDSYLSNHISSIPINEVKKIIEYMQIKHSYEIKVDKCIEKLDLIIRELNNTNLFPNKSPKLTQDQDIINKYNDKFTSQNITSEYHFVLPLKNNS